jgi:hypothetical protein
MKRKWTQRTSAKRRFNHTLQTIIGQWGSGYTVQPHLVSQPVPRSTIPFRIRMRRGTGRGTVYKPVKLSGPVGRLP